MRRERFILKDGRGIALDMDIERAVAIHDAEAPTPLLLFPESNGYSVLEFGGDYGTGYLTALSVDEEQRLCDALKDREAVRKRWA
jgi:hypothetical protein